MSTNSTDIDEKNLIPTYIKLENDTDDDDDESMELNDTKDSYSNLSSKSENPSLSLPNKGQIEVTSKGRRKIFDGVRWQILCRRPDCRKQTNKKSLCITHYKEEYESNPQSSWSKNLPSFQIPSYTQRQSFDSTKTHSRIENQNTINSSTPTEQSSLNSTNQRTVHVGEIKYLNNDRRCIYKNNKWQLLCKHNGNCRNISKYGSLCIKHYELTQEKQRDTFKHANNDKQRLYTSLLDKHRAIVSSEITKRLKITDFQRSSTSVTEQFDINSNENLFIPTKPIDNNSSSLTSKLSDHEISTSPELATSSLFDQRTSKLKNDQSVQTDLTIPLCCVIHYEDHSFTSSCYDNKFISSTISFQPKSEP